MTEQALTVQSPLTPQTWSMIQNVAPAMYASRFFGVSSNEQAMAIMLKGYELGLSLSASFEFVHVIQGKPSLSPRGMLALIQESPALAGMKIQDITDDEGVPKSCEVWMKRQNGFEYTARFSMDDAKRAGLVKPGGGWGKYPGNMLRWRAVGFCADVVFPDVLGGMKRADELGADLTPDGDVVEGEFATTWDNSGNDNPAPAAASPKPASKPQATTNGKCPVCHATGGHAPWCQEVNGQRVDTRGATGGPDYESVPDQDGDPAPQEQTESGRATVKTSEWAGASVKLAEDWPHYQKNGAANGYHMTTAAQSLGYPEITDDNLAEVVAALEKHAADKQAQDEEQRVTPI